MFTTDTHKAWNDCEEFRSNPAFTFITVSTPYLGDPIQLPSRERSLLVAVMIELEGAEALTGTGDLVFFDNDNKQLDFLTIHNISLTGDWTPMQWGLPAECIDTMNLGFSIANESLGYMKAHFLFVQCEDLFEDSAVTSYAFCDDSGAPQHVYWCIEGNAMGNVLTMAELLEKTDAGAANTFPHDRVKPIFPVTYPSRLTTTEEPPVWIDNPPFTQSVRFTETSAFEEHHNRGIHKKT